MVTEADLIAEFGDDEIMQLSARATTALPSAIAWADSLVAGYLHAAGLTAPSPLPADLRGVLCDAVRWRLYDDALTEVVAVRFQNAMDWLKAVAAGRIVPIWEVAGTAGNGLAYTLPDPIFTRWDESPNGASW